MSAYVRDPGNFSSVASLSFPYIDLVPGFR